MLKQLATARYFWLRAARFSPASRLRLAVYQGFPWMAPDKIRINLRNMSVSPQVRCRTTDIFVLLEVFADLQYKMPAEFRPPAVIVDAGANIGLASLFFATQYPNSTIVAIEPDVENFRMLLSNTERHKNIRPIRAALWHEHEELELHDPGIGSWGLRVSPIAEGKSEIDTVTMDDLVSVYGRVDLLKMDIEGAERDVLRNSSSWFGSIGALAVELHDTETTDVLSVFDDLTRSFLAFGGRNSVTIVIRPDELQLSRS